MVQNIPIRTITSPNNTEDVISCYTPTHMKAYQPHSNFLILTNIFLVNVW